MQVILRQEAEFRLLLLVPHLERDVYICQQSMDVHGKHKSSKSFSTR